MAETTMRHVSLPFPAFISFSLSFPAWQSESRRRQSVDHALHDAETKLRDLGRRHETNAATAAAPSNLLNGGVLAELREQVSRARERAANLEELLDEKTRANRRLEREVAEAVELGVSATSREV